MLRSPHPAEVVSLMALFAKPTRLSWTAKHTLRKTRPTGCVPTQTQQKEKSKRKGSDIVKETKTNYDVPTECVDESTSFKGFV